MAKKRGKKKLDSKLSDRVDFLSAGINLMMFLSVLGFVIEVYMTWLFYSPLASSFCVSCQDLAVVSTFLGFPSSLFSALGFLLLLFAGLRVMFDFDWPMFWKALKPRHFVGVAALFAAVKLALSVGFFVTFFPVSLCLMCFVSLVIDLIILVVILVIAFLCRKWKYEFMHCGVDYKTLCRFC